MALAVPRTLSPSKASAFTDCPLAFRFSIIDRLPEPPSPAAVKGTLVHAALERLFWDHVAGQRTMDAGLSSLAAAWEAIQDDPEFVGLELDAEGAAAFLADAEVLVRNYFRIEDPNEVRTVGVEMGIETSIGGMTLRGIIDRLDVTDDGELVVIDYKTGRAPSAQFERSRLNGVHTYALLCAQVLGRFPSHVKLLYLRDPLAIVATPTEQSVRGHRTRTAAVWTAIERSCEREDFRPRPSGLCRFCNFQELCPAYAQLQAVAS
jgi:putative RecB family exonuclease